MYEQLIREGQAVDIEIDEDITRAMIRSATPDEVILVPLEASRSHERIKLPADIIKNMVEEKKIQFLSVNRQHNGVTFDLLPEEDKEETLKKYQYIRDILDSGTTAFTEKNTKNIIHKTAGDYKETPPNWSTVRRWYEQYKKAGHQLSGLFSRKAFRGKSRLQIDERAEEIISKHANNYYKQSQPSIQSIFDDIEAEIERFNNNNLDNPIKAPKYSAVRDRLQNNTYRKKKEKRTGKHAMQAELAGKDNGINTSSVLQRVEMDHTQLDIYLLDDEDHTLIGRPYLTILIDHYSHMVLGFQLSFENPSFAAASLACINAFLPKTFHHDFNVNYQWPAHGVPKVIVIDNGKEFWGKNFQTSASELGIILQYCPIRKAWYKSCVERFYGIVRTRVTDNLPGTVKKKGKCGDDYDAKSEAKMTFSEFRKYFLTWLLGEYHNSLVKKHNKTPNQLWQASEDFLAVPKQSKKNILPKLMASGIRTNDSGTIQYENLFYSSHFLKDLLIRDGKQKVTFKYNPFDLGCILVFDAVNRIYSIVDCDDYAYAKNLSFYEHKQIKKKNQQAGRDSLNPADLTQTKIELFEMREASRNKNVKNAKQESAARDKRSEQKGIVRHNVSELTPDPEFIGNDSDLLDLDDTGWSVNNG